MRTKRSEKEGTRKPRPGLTRISALRSVALLALLTFLGAGVAARADIFVVSPPTAQAPEPACPLCDIVERQIAQGCGPQDGQPFADVYELRHPGQLVLPESAHAAMSRARATQDPAAAERRLSPLFAHPDPEVRYVSGITVAMMHLQAGAIAADAAGTALSVAGDAARSPGFSIPASDLAFLLARRARDRGDDDSARADLTEALNLEPRYFNALVLKLEMALERANLVGRQSRALCESAYFEFMAVLVQIMDLSPCRLHAAHLDIHLSRHFMQPDALPAIQMARVYLALLAERPSAAMAALARFGEAPLPCRESLMPELKQLLRTTGTEVP